MGEAITICGHQIGEIDFHLDINEDRKSMETKGLLIHTSNVKVDVLRPQIQKYGKPCICLSLNQFISHFGEYIYLFQKEVLEKNFYIEEISSGGVECLAELNFYPNRHTLKYRSKDLGQEFRIYEPIDVGRYGIGIISNFNHMKGVLEKKFDEIVMKEIIDLEKKETKP